ncbi:MAG: hypothetical protein MJA82_15060 [Clostridia bacterium]|nr:hypothetical protein [Clostridia bacterium]
MKLCRCGKVIERKMKYCMKCLLVIEQQRKERHKYYDKTRQDDKYWKFYKTKEWIKLRAYVLAYYDQLDLYEYYVNNRIVEANTSHHIIEIKDNWRLRLEFSNQFPCSESTHNRIHKLYEKDKKGIQKLLLSILEKYKEEYKS